MTRESDRRAAGTYEWVHVVTSIDFDESPDLADATGRIIKRPAGKTLKGVAFRISYWGNADGSKVYLGPARISVTCEVDYKTAKVVLRTLCAYKLLTLVQRGGGVTTPEREGNGGEYQLTIPHNLAEIATVRSKEEIDAAIEEVKEKNRNKTTGKRRPRDSRGTDAPVTEVSEQGVTGQSVPGPVDLRGNHRVSHGATGSAIPTQHQPVKENQPSSSPTVGPDTSPRSNKQEEGETDDSKNRADLALMAAAARLVDPYRHSMNVIESNRLVSHVVTVLAKGWPEQSVVDALASDLAGLDSVAAGLIGRMKELAAAPIELGSDNSVAAGPACSTCGDTGRVETRSVYEGDALKVNPCHDCTNDGRGRCRLHLGESSRRCGQCRALAIAVKDQQGRRVNAPEGARTAEWERRRQQHRQDAPAGYTRRPDGRLLLTDSHDPNIDWEAKI